LQDPDKERSGSSPDDDNQRLNLRSLRRMPILPVLKVDERTMPVLLDLSLPFGILLLLAGAAGTVVVILSDWKALVRRASAVRAG
jgi:hypothetical protein